MNYDITLTELTEALQADKSIPQPYRNAVASSARRLHAEIRGARTFSNLKPVSQTFDGLGTAGASNSAHDAAQGDGAQNTNVAQCICPPGTVDRSCPLHAY